MNQDTHGAAALAAGLELDGLASLVRSFTVRIGTRSGTSMGSGVIWQSDGMIVTNAHVVRDERPLVSLDESGSLEARIVALDRRRDLALLSLDADGLRAAPIGDVESLRAGSLVLALGHPHGVANAMSLGVVHLVTTRRGMPRYIAADLRLAPGNSGGPLVDTTGRVVGINAMIVGGLGVAIPSTVVRRFLHEVSRSGAAAFASPLAA
ncbi:MAG: trypsin-like peptidase domain-containing protein [Gemmatimonadaceae bacterium]|nr:trypsin-like peptidase domain-containing protein [Gemmatimonadaceae bacterium]